MKLPTCVLRLLHDCEPGRVSWGEHRDFLVDRILGEGDWEAIRWLRDQGGDEVVLDLAEDEVSAGIRDPRWAIWDRRSP